MIETTYVIVKKIDLTMTMINESVNNVGNIRECATGVNVILKFKDAYPNSAAGFQKFNHGEIIQLLKTDDWLHNQEEI
jgi:hypothetical protein